MAQASKTFRIFVSSTFEDLKEERNALQKYVCPRLRELCMLHGCRFQAIDLRWGVSEEASRDQQTVKICLEEVKRCQHVTPRPNFVVLLGDRYGWRPLPAEIPADEFDQIERRVTDARDKGLLTHWYKRDDNAVPPVYCLQPRLVKFGTAQTEEEKEAARKAEADQWQETEQRLRQILISAIAQLPLNGEQRLKYEASATEQEISAGALSIKDAPEHVFCFFRKIQNLPRDCSAKDFVDLDENYSPNPDAAAKLEGLKSRLERKLPGNIHDYNADWAGVGSVGAEAIYQRCKHVMEVLSKEIAGLALETLPQLGSDAWARLGQLRDHALEEALTGADESETTQIQSPITLGHLPKLCVDVYLALVRVILHEIARLEKIEALEKEITDHDSFGEERARSFIGRASILKTILDYVASEDRYPLAVWGESGSGKSALMARAIAECGVRNAECVMVSRFIGATPASSDVRSLLESICRQVSRIYGGDEATIPTDYKELVKELPQRLALANSDKPLVVFLDALDQLSDADHARNLIWLPRELPEHVRLVVSILPGECKSALERRLPATNLVKLAPMPSEEGSELLEVWLKEAGRTLQLPQRDNVLRKFAASGRPADVRSDTREEGGMPLYLKLAFEEARRWKSYSLPVELDGDIPSVIRQLFERLSRDANHGKLMVERSLGYLAAAKNGLTEDELLDVLSGDEEVLGDFKTRAKHTPPEERLPVIVWSRLYFDLEPYLTERAGDGVSLLSFYHRQLGEVTAQKYLTGEGKQRAHKHLADYFDSQDYWLETPKQYRNRVGEFPTSARRSNLRKAVEFPWQLRQIGDWDRLEQIHTILDFLESKTAAGLVFELAQDFAAALKRIPSERPLWRIVHFFEEALRRDIHFIARHREDYPQALFQCLWNSCWWYDCPEAARHYETSDGPWSRPGLKLHELLEAWRAAREENYRGFCWVRSLRPPPQHLGTAQIAILKGREVGEMVSSVAISADSRRIVSGSRDNTIRVWDLETGEELKVLKGHEGSVTSVVISADSRRIVSGSRDETVRVWDLETGEELKVLKGHESIVTSVAISADSRRIVSGSRDETVRIWDMETGEELKVLKGHEGPERRTRHYLQHYFQHRGYVESVAISADSRQIVSGSGDNTVRVWDMETGAERKVLKGHEGGVNSVAISGDSRQIVSGSDDGTVRIWDMEVGEELRVLKGHEDSVTSVAISADSRRIVSGGGPRDKTVRIWDMEVGEELKLLKGHKERIESVAISADSRRIVSGSWDKTIRIWDPESGEELKELKGHKHWVMRVAISTDSRRIVSVSLDKTVRIWDTETGEELKVLKGHKNSVESVAISADSRRIVSGSWDNTVRIWNMETGKELNVLKGHEEKVSSIAISADSRRIVSGSNDGTVRIWDMETGEELKVLKGHEERVTSVSISTDGRRIVSGSRDKTVRVWDMETGEELKVLKGHESIVTSVAISADGRRIVTGSWDRTIRIWDPETGKELEILAGMGADVQTIADPLIFPLRALSQISETVVEDEYRKVLAFFPESLSFIKTHSDAKSWAGGVGNYLCIIRLEGGSELSN